MMVRDSCSSPRIAGAAVADFYSQVHTFPQQCFTNSSQFVLGTVLTVLVRGTNYLRHFVMGKLYFMYKNITQHRQLVYYYQNDLG